MFVATAHRGRMSTNSLSCVFRSQSGLSYFRWSTGIFVVNIFLQAFVKRSKDRKSKQYFPPCFLVGDFSETSPKSHVWTIITHVFTSIKPFILIQHAIYYLRKECFDATVLDLPLYAKSTEVKVTFEGLEYFFFPKTPKASCLSAKYAIALCLMTAKRILRNIHWTQFSFDSFPENKHNVRHPEALRLRISTTKCDWVAFVDPPP